MRDDPPRYIFGDTPLAALRLEFLSDALEPSIRAFLADAAPRSPRLALDLGCGPGASTRLAAETTGAKRTVGVDTSMAFLEIASARPAPGVTFVQHDATSVPLPAPPPTSFAAVSSSPTSPTRPRRFERGRPSSHPGVGCSSTRWSGSTRHIRSWRHTKPWSWTWSNRAARRWMPGRS